MTVAVLLMALGGPDSLENVEPYLLEVRGGRATPPALVEEIRDRYRATGGKSPVLDITRELAAKVGARRRVPVFVGLRHWRPRISEAWAELLAAGPHRAVAVCMAPHRSSMTVGKYYEQLDAAIAELGGADLPLARVQSWATHPLFIDALTSTVKGGLWKFAPDERDRVPVIFTAHSLPQRVIDAGDPYVGEVAATVEALQGLLNHPGETRFAFQSQGRSNEPWIGPEVEPTLKALADAGHRNVLIAPVGFLSDHVEVNYDIDIEFRSFAETLGMRLERAPMLNASLPMVDIIVALVDEALAGGDAA